MDTVQWTISFLSFFIISLSLSFHPLVCTSTSKVIRYKMNSLLLDSARTLSNVHASMLHLVNREHLPQPQDKPPPSPPDSYTALHTKSNKYVSSVGSGSLQRGALVPMEMGGVTS
jgi:hypothetical protein